MKAIGRKVVIRPKEKEEVTSSGIVMVSVHTDQYAEGTVFAIGEDVKGIPTEAKVIYSPLTFDEIKYDNNIYHVVDSDDVFAIIEE